jgi:hypothetical protein
MMEEKIAKANKYVGKITAFAIRCRENLEWITNLLLWVRTAIILLVLSRIVFDDLMGGKTVKMGGYINETGLILHRRENKLLR